VGIITLLMNFVFVLVIYCFIFSIIRLIYMDIKSINYYISNSNGKHPYLKLINQREMLNFRIEETYLLTKECSIGRDAKSDIIIKDPFISSQHAQIVKKEGIYYIKDTGSKNGTFVNDNPLKIGFEWRLNNGDKIRLGQVEFLFVDILSKA